MKTIDDKISVWTQKWCMKLNIPMPVLEANNKMKWAAYISRPIKGNVNYVFTYNKYKIIQTKPITSLDDIKWYDIHMVILHELGHIHKWHFEIQEEDEEYYAERFALDNLKKYKPGHYKSYLKAMRKSKSMKYWKKYSIKHWKAFCKIEEYKDDYTKT